MRRFPAWHWWWVHHVHKCQAARNGSGAPLNLGNVSCLWSENWQCYKVSKNWDRDHVRQSVNATRSNQLQNLELKCAKPSCARNKGTDEGPLEWPTPTCIKGMRRKVFRRGHRGTPSPNHQQSKQGKCCRENATCKEQDKFKLLQQQHPKKTVAIVKYNAIYVYRMYVHISYITYLWSCSSWQAKQ